MSNVAKHHLNDNEHFLKADGLKTEAGAESRITKVAVKLPFQEFPLTLVIQRKDGLFVPCAIIGEKTSHLADALARSGIYVLNAI